MFKLPIIILGIAVVLAGILRVLQDGSILSQWVLVIGLVILGLGVFVVPSDFGGFPSNRDGAGRQPESGDKASGRDGDDTIPDDLRS